MIILETNEQKKDELNTEGKNDFKFAQLDFVKKIIVLVSIYYNSAFIGKKIKINIS